MAASKKTKRAITRAVQRWNDPNDGFGKLDFYAVVFPLIKKRRVTFAEASEITKDADTVFGKGVSRRCLMDRARYFRKRSPGSNMFWLKYVFVDDQSIGSTIGEVDVSK